MNYKRFGPVTLRAEPREYFRGFFTDIENLPLRSPEDKAKAELRVGAKGASLFKMVVPDDLQALLWSLRDSIQYVQIQSEEPFIPWELCKLEGRVNGRVTEGPFLCEAFAITRSASEIPIKPTLTLKRIGLVVPQDSRLPFAAAEPGLRPILGNRTAERRANSGGIPATTDASPAESMTAGISRAMAASPTKTPTVLSWFWRTLKCLS